MKKCLSILLAGCMLLGGAGLLGGCGKGGYGPDTVVIFKEYHGSIGSEDDVVKAAIEKKFKADTGFDIDLRVEALGEMLGQKATGALTTPSERIDGFVNHYTSDAMITNYMLDGLVKDLGPLAEQYAPEFLKYFNEENDPNGLAYNAGVFGGKLRALSSMEHTSAWGALVRKDYMANTSFDPDEYDVANPGYKSLSLDQFKTLLVELKANNSDCVRPLVGASWNVDEIVAPVFGAVKYINKIKDEEGNILPAYASEGYFKLFEFERWMMENKLWIESSMQNVDQYFAAGKGAVYISWPEVTSQIKIANQLKAAQGADCIMLAPLLKEGSNTETNGNLRQTRAYVGMCVHEKGQNTELLMRYMNWMYSSKENYELCKYGVKGEHWVEADRNGVEMYDYPADKKASYLMRLPYSGKYCLLDNYLLSDRIYADCTDKQLAWVDEIRSMPSFPADGYVDEGVLTPNVPATDRRLRARDAAMGNAYVSVRGYSWSDAPLGDYSLRARWEDLVAGMYDPDQYKPVIDFHTRNYNAVIESRK